ncbi:MAG: FAD-dependent oxidoreductase [Nocardioidaceae bacterium]|nr:FAD-dependent oxidoreductase [Nocardioidaceae bacterium]MCL2614510.1 FAD-dependent oxidoreductase [Nocardioidaceae bacterium]
MPPTPSVSRRGVVAGAAATAAVAASLDAAPSFAAPAPGKRVLVLGGGVGGLTAAHELAERGFSVTVVEPKALGGKARSITVPGTGTGGRGDLPGEHGFRFFPGFYKNIPDTMSRIPVKGQANGVFDDLVAAKQEVFTLPQGQLWMMPTPNEAGLLEGMKDLVTALGVAAAVPANQIVYFVRKLAVFLTSCDERRLGQWEKVGWAEFTNSANFSPAYRTVFGEGLTKDLVAAKGSLASTRTVGLMAEAFVYALLCQESAGLRKQSGYGAADRLLDGPTSEVWIDPWVAHLKSLGVHFVGSHRISHITMQGKRVGSVTLQRTDANGDPVAGAAKRTMTADWYVAAMPAEQMARLVTGPMTAVAPELAGIARLRTDWMNGIQFFLDRQLDVPIHGHVAFLDTPWALTAIEQGVFWRKDISASYGDGSVKDIFSVDISDFFTPGILYGKPASECTPQQIANEVWAQIKRSLNTKEQPVIDDDMLVRWFLDPAIHYPRGKAAPAANREPLLINTAGSWADRPEAATSIHNLMLASDYVRTNIDLATMEGANEAGRAAANAILSRSGSTAAPASLGTLWQPQELALLRDTDRTLYRQGRPNVLDVFPENFPI